MKTAFLALAALIMAPAGFANTPVQSSNFGDDLALLKQHTDVVVLSDRSGKAEVAVAPAYQGRVMTSTADGGDGVSYGWINHALIASGKTQPHINAYGGEDRIWFGPEGGQFGLFFPPKAPFDYAHWQTPAPMDTQAWAATTRSRRAVAFHKTITLTNWSGTRFHFRVDREVRLLSPAQVSAVTGVSLPPTVHAVGYETDNRMTNEGSQAWRSETGLLSIWILGQYNPSSTGAIVIPFKPGPVSRIGRVANDAYFGKVPPDRLAVDADKGVLFFKDDGKRRGKIGIGPNRVLDTLGSYDPVQRVLTLVRFSTASRNAPYVNSMWETQKNPYAGDVANSYNDGPLADGTQLGPFYELESSSPAAALAPGQSISHLRMTVHLQGPTPVLDAIAFKTLHVHLKDVEEAFH